MTTHFSLAEQDGVSVLRLTSDDGMHRLTRARVLALSEVLEQLARRARPLVMTGEGRFFSAGAELQEIRSLDAPEAYAFALMGQRLMDSIESFPAPVAAAIGGYCMGGGLDLALACRFRVAAPEAVFGHRGPALGIMTGWGGTQRLPRLVGRARALQMFVTAETVAAHEALRIGLVDAIDDHPVAIAVALVRSAGSGDR